ncbi:MAG: hypothetical protein PVS3B3_10820 [Ktedonobacteraceae bacterium]
MQAMFHYSLDFKNINFRENPELYRIGKGEQGAAQVMRNRFFDEMRVDGTLQRSYLANVLRFYFERSRRYKLFDSEAETSSLEHVTRLEKTGLKFRPSYEGYVVNLDDEPRNKPLLIENAKITLLTARCRPLLEMNLFRPTENAVDLLTLVRSGLVIDLHNLFSETLQMATGAFMLRKLYKDMFHWGYADRLRLAIVLDEAHRLAKDITLPKLMKEGRKFGIAVIVASQGVADFHPDVLSNAGTKVIFRMNYPESRKVSGFIRTRQGQELSERIEQLSVGSAYVQTPEMMYGSVVKM